MMNRLEAIDQFRGFAILLMILANYMNNVQVIPAWLKHSEDIVYTAADLIARLFVFAMGLTYGLSFRRRLGWDGAWDTYKSTRMARGEVLDTKYCMASSFR